MKQFTRLYNSLGMLAMLCLASCASEELNDRLLPEGKYPMTFATAMEEQIPTRATADNTWAGDEKIAMQVGSEVKEYKPTSGNPSTLTAVNAINSFYWQKAEENVSAWYSGADYHATLPTSFSVKPDQRNSGYQQSDFLYAKPQNIKYSNRTTDPLIFKHLPAKVVVNLKYGDGLTAEEVTNATVYLVNQATTSGEIDGNKGTVVQANPGETEILTNELTESVEEYQKSVQALVVPQQMQKKKFIKVTIGKDAAARDYYYTPKEETEANLKCGMQYTYNITVTKGEGLVVTTTEPSVSWEDGTASSGKVEEAQTFYVTCPKNSEVESFVIQDVDDQGGGKYTVKANTTITISYKPNSISHRYYLAQGFANVSASIEDDNETVTLTVSAIRGDLVFAFEERIEIGDYYYSDGTWANVYYKNKVCIGLVFKLGAGIGDAASNYGSKLPNGIRGYVVALQDANENAGAWGIRQVNVDGITDEGSYVNKYDGYSNTVVVRQLNEYKNTNVSTPRAEGQYWAFKVASEYDAVTPANTSGWYLPSIGQLNDIYYLPNRYALIKAAGGSDFKGGGSNVRYWSSTEKHDADAWYYRFNGDRDGYDAYAKGDEDRNGNHYLTPAYVRAILTF